MPDAGQTGEDGHITFNGNNNLSRVHSAINEETKSEEGETQDVRDMKHQFAMNFLGKKSSTPKEDSIVNS